MKKKQIQTRGFTLAEVIAALAVVVVGVLPLSLLFVSSRQLSNQAQIQCAAYNVAREEMEKLRALNFNDRTINTTVSFPISPTVAALYVNNTYNMSGSYYITSPYWSDPKGVYNTQQIVVRVSWTNADQFKSTSFVQLDTINSNVAGD